MTLDETARALVDLALAEDLGRGGDVTATATIPPDATGAASFVARSAGVVAGVETVAAVCTAVDPALVVQVHLDDGTPVGAGDRIATVRGPMLALLAAERTALNFLCHLSGVATLAARYAAEVGGTGCVVRDTRKTLPGMRMLQKAAVAAGGGTNHRMGLYDGLLVKDNHVAAAGGVAAATRAALDHAGGLTVQVEVDDLAQLDEALGAGVRTILLDNFDVESLRTAVARCRNLDEPVFLEASGGITLDSVRDIAATGVDAIAVGALTHSAPGLDIGLDYGEDA